jgi:hypothetical protein
MTQLELSRRALELSQDALGRKILYSKAIVSRLESGVLPIESVHPRLRRALEVFFQTSLEELLKPVPPKRHLISTGTVTV